MKTQAYLIFELNHLQYGIHTEQVREIFQLPELTPIVDAPGDIIGILNFRDKILPIMHLAKRLGQDTLSCQLSDSVIVIEWQGLQIGMVVNQVHEVHSVLTSTIEVTPTYQLREHAHTSFVAGIVELEESLITLLNPETLIRQTDDVALMMWEATLDKTDEITLDKIESDNSQTAFPTERVMEAQVPPVLTDFFSLYCPQATAEDKAVFRQRSHYLRQTLDSSDTSHLTPLVVIQLGAEHFGLDLHRVREFINVRHVMTIPCCPTHIVGNMNLRGEIMTLVDIRELLNLTESHEPIAKAVVIEVDDIVAGITVDQVLDVVYLPPTAISSMPTAVSEQRQLFFQGVTDYRQTPLSILDLSNLLLQGGMVVDQAA